MPTLVFALAVLAGPELTTWKAHVPYAVDATITVYPARGLAADSTPCLSDPTKTLIDERCADQASNAALIASVAKEPPLKALATAKTDSEGHFQVQVPPGRLFVRVATGNHFTDFVVDPVEGVETTLKSGGSASRLELDEEIAALIEAKAAGSELAGAFWVIGQDNPQVVKLKKADVDALRRGAFRGPAFLWGCSKVVSAKGRLLGTTCEPKEGGLQRDPELELTGQVLFEGRPQAGVLVRRDGREGAVQTDERGRFSLWSVVGAQSRAMLVAERGELRGAALIEVEWREGLVAVPLVLHLSREPLPLLSVRDEAGTPLAGASARFWYHGHARFGTTDERGEVLAPPSLKTAFVTVRAPGRTPFAGWLDLPMAEPVVLRRAAPVEVRFQTRDGVLLHQPDVRCEGCDVLEQRPSRDGRVVLSADDLPAFVQVGAEDVTISKAGVVTLPSRAWPAAAEPSKFEVVADGLKLDWSTKSGQPEPGRQFVRACAYRGCETRVVDVPDSGTITIAPLKEFSLEVITKGFKAGAKMPSYLSLAGPNVQAPLSGAVDRDGVARFRRVPAGPWRVSVESDREGPWCFAGKPCELDLSASAPAPLLKLEGAVPERVRLSSSTFFSSEHDEPVQNGAVEISAGSTVVVERTSRFVDDGGVRVLKLSAPVDVQVTVLDPRRQPVRDALVSVGLPEPYGWLAPSPALTDVRGRAVFADTRPGNLPVRVAKAGFALATTVGTKEQNEVVLAPGKSLTCRVSGVRKPAEVLCSARFDGGQAEAEYLRDGSVTLRDLPEKVVVVSLAIIEHDPAVLWTLTREVDLAKTGEVAFAVPRKGRALVLDASTATVTVEGVGQAFCAPIRPAGGSTFCQTPPIPPGRVKIELNDGTTRFPFEVPAGEGRLLVARPEATP